MRRTDQTDDILANRVVYEPEFQDLAESARHMLPERELEEIRSMSTETFDFRANSVLSDEPETGSRRRRTDQSRMSVMTEPSRDEIDAKMQASEARTETKIAKLDGKIDLLVSKVDSIGVGLAENRRDSASNRNTIIGTVLATGLALAALLLGAATYGDAIFGRGMQVRDVVNALASELLEKQAANQRRSQQVAP